MAPVSTYLRTNNLHWKPVSSILARGVSIVGANLAQEGSNQSLMKQVIAKGIFYVGNSSIIVLSLVEGISSISIGTIGVGINALFYKNRSEFWQKHSVRCFAYGTNCFLVMGYLAMQMILNMKPTHSEAAFSYHSIHFRSAVFIHKGLNSLLDQQAGREVIAEEERIRFLLEELSPEVFTDIGVAMRRDNIPVNIERMPGIQDHLVAHIDFVQDLLNFERNRYRSDSTYARRIDEGWLETVRESEIFGVPVIGNEGEYRGKLCRHIKRAFLELYRRPNLWRLLNKGDEEGRSRLKDMDPEVIQQLCIFIQYKELLLPIQCPDELNERQRGLLEAQGSLELLSPRQKALLEEMCMTTDKGEDEGVNSAFGQIRALSSYIERGISRFRGGFQEAIKEIQRNKNE